MIVGLIPSRLNSNRLYQKPLIRIDGLPTVIHTMKRAIKADENMIHVKSVLVKLRKEVFFFVMFIINLKTGVKFLNYFFLVNHRILFQL